MALLQSLLDDLNDRLNDANNAAGAGEAAKIRWINSGQAAMYPKIFKTVSDDSTLIVADTYEYTLPATFDYSKIVRVELESGEATNRFVHLFDFEIIPLQTGKVVRLDHLELPVAAGARMRVSAVKPLTAMTSTGSTYEGPPGTEEIPVWYALGLALGRRLEDRIVHTRYSTTAAANGVDIEEIMSASQFAFAQFELLLERHSMVLPAQAG